MKTLYILSLIGLLSEPAKPKQYVRNEAALKREIRMEMKAYEILCLDVDVAQSGCLWVYVLDNGKNRDGLATTLCSTAKRYAVRCVTIFDAKQNRLGYANCK